MTQTAAAEVLPVTQILPPRKFSSKEMKAFSTRFPADLAAELERIAKKHGYSMNELINFIAEWGVTEIAKQDQEKEAKAASEEKAKKK